MASPRGAGPGAGGQDDGAADPAEHAPAQREKSVTFVASSKSMPSATSGSDWLPQGAGGSDASAHSQGGLLLARDVGDLEQWTWDQVAELVVLSDASAAAEAERKALVKDIFMHELSACSSWHLASSRICAGAVKLLIS